ncbi:MAG: hypothetical protein M3Y81_10380 [Chloroflexota bacterium]|nr:hypothetical protein [Chloroflexota bacterium]
MKPLDDFLPEETHNPELITALRQTQRQPDPITASEREETIAHARERLSSQVSGMASPDEEVLRLAGVTDSSLLPVLVPTQKPRHARMMRLLNMIAATLIVGAIIGASLVLFSRRDAPSQVTTLDSQGKYVTVTSSAGGLEMGMHLPVGPYFLSEMLTVDISLTNHTDKAVDLGSPFMTYSCGYNISYDTGVQIVGGSKPEYKIPMPTAVHCPAFWRDLVLKPGHTLSVHKYLPLTLSGQMTLVGKTQFYKPGVHYFPDPAASPLDNHWPALHITVSSHIPADRVLSLQRTNTQVTVLAPAGKQLLYMYTIACTGTWGGIFAWEPISKTTIKPYDDYCRRVQVDWTFIFAVPGYAMFTGEGKFQAP